MLSTTAGVRLKCQKPPETALAPASGARTSTSARRLGDGVHRRRDYIVMHKIGNSLAKRELY